jgi:group I intron endonuclease
MKNNKIYIGKTSANPTRRWRDHVRDSLKSKTKKQLPIHRAILKYGLDNFKFDIIEYLENENLAYLKEIEYISQFKSNKQKFGYNLTSGGRGFGDSGRKLGPRAIKNIFKDYINTDMCTSEIAIKYKINLSSIKDILNRKIYISIAINDETLYQTWLKRHRKFIPKMNENGKLIKLKARIIPDIFTKFIKLKSLTKVAKIFNVQISNIEFVLRRQTWKTVPIDSKIITKTQKILNDIRHIIRDDASRVDIKTQIFKVYPDKNKLNYIGKTYKLSQQKIYNILDMKLWQNIIIESQLLKIIDKIPLQRRMKQIIPSVKLTIISLFESGKTIEEISDQLKISKQKLRHALKLKDPNYGRYSHIVENVFDDFIAGLKINEISKKYNCDRHIVLRIIRRQSYKEVIISELKINLAQSMYKIE